MLTLRFDSLDLLRCCSFNLFQASGATELTQECCHDVECALCGVPRFFHFNIVYMQFNHCIDSVIIIVG